MIPLDHQGSGASVSQIKFPVVLMKVNCNTSFTPKLMFSAHHDALFVLWNHILHFQNSMMKKM